jgi:hypothetical protein
MIFLRLAGILILIGIIVLAIFYIVTKNKKYLQLIRLVLNYVIYASVIILLIYFLFRIIHT